RGELIGDERGRLVELVPGPRDAQRALELRLVGPLELRVAEDVLAVVEVPDVAVREEAPRLALVLGKRAVEGVEIGEGGLDLVLLDEIVDRRDDAAGGEVRNPGWRRVDDVEGAVRGDVL